MTGMAEKFTRQQVLEIENISPALFRLRCTRDSSFRFNAGQFARLGVRKANGCIVWRPYSMVSAPHDEFLEFFSIRVPEGEFTTELDRLQLGDELLVERQPFGFLTFERFVGGDTLWLLASGTGLAPFLSILQEPAVWQRFKHIVLVYCVRNASELAYQDLIKGLTARDYLAEHWHKLRYLPLITREHVPGTLHGRITRLLETGELEAAAGLQLEPEQARVMLCGNPQMIDDCRDLLKLRGMQLDLVRRPGQIAVENYW